MSLRSLAPGELWTSEEISEDLSEKMSESESFSLRIPDVMAMASSAIGSANQVIMSYSQSEVHAELESEGYLTAVKPLEALDDLPKPRQI